MSKPVLIVLVILVFFAGFATAYFLLPDHSYTPAPEVSTTRNCEMTSIRRSGFDYTKPLLYVEQSCEAPEWAILKKKLNELIAQMKTDGQLEHTAVYVRDFEKGYWMGIHEDHSFHPGSLSKVPVMMAYLRKAEANPAILDEVYTFEPPAKKGELDAIQNYLSRQNIQPGGKYTVRELLAYAIVHSDNNAAWLLWKKLPDGEMERVYYDVGVSTLVLDPSDSTYRTTARHFSVFLRALYNASFVSPEYSDYGLKLLGQAQFNQGFKKGLPADAKVAHKFAEWDNGKTFELHESGILYIKGKGYLLTIMTRADSRDKLPNALGALTKEIYHFLSGP